MPHHASVCAITCVNMCHDSFCENMCAMTHQVHRNTECGKLQCVAVCCNVLQCVAVCCSVLQFVASCCSMLQCVAECCSVLQCVVGFSSRTYLLGVSFWCHCLPPSCVALCSNVLQCVAVCCSLLQCVAVWCNVLQYVIYCASTSRNAVWRVM